METIDKWLTAILEWAEKIPMEGWAIILGVVISGAVTQWFKRAFPVALIFPGKGEVAYKSAIRVIALVLGFLPTFFLWPVDSAFRVWAALAVGFGTPMFYRLCTFLLYKKWPKLEARLSGDP